MIRFDHGYEFLPLQKKRPSLWEPLGHGLGLVLVFLGGIWVLGTTLVELEVFTGLAGVAQEQLRLSHLQALSEELGWLAQGIPKQVEGAVAMLLAIFALAGLAAFLDRTFMRRHAPAVSLPHWASQLRQDWSARWDAIQDLLAAEEEVQALVPLDCPWSWMGVGLTGGVLIPLLGMALLAPGMALRTALYPTAFVADELLLWSLAEAWILFGLSWLAGPVPGAARFVLAIHWLGLMVSFGMGLGQGQVSVCLASLGFAFGAAWVVFGASRRERTQMALVFTDRGFRIVQAKGEAVAVVYGPDRIQSLSLAPGALDPRWMFRAQRGAEFDFEPLGTRIQDLESILDLGGILEGPADCGRSSFRQELGSIWLPVGAYLSLSLFLGLFLLLRGGTSELQRTLDYVPGPKLVEAVPDPESRRRLLENLTALAPDSPDFWLELACYLERQGLVERAQGARDRARDLVAEARFHPYPVSQVRDQLEKWDRVRSLRTLFLKSPASLDFPTLEGRQAFARALTLWWQIDPQVRSDPFVPPETERLEALFFELEAEAKRLPAEVSLRLLAAIIGLEAERAWASLPGTGTRLGVSLSLENPNEQRIFSLRTRRREVLEPLVRRRDPRALWLARLALGVASRPEAASSLGGVSREIFVPSEPLDLEAKTSLFEKPLDLDLLYSFWPWGAYQSYLEASKG